MNKQKGISTLLSVLIALLVIAGGVVTYKYYSVSEEGASTKKAGESQDETTGEFFRVDQPELNQKIISPVQIKGEAKLFEHEVLNEWITVEINDGNGHKLGSDKIKTENGKIEGPFLQDISYEQPTSGEGLIKIFEYIPREGFIPTEGVLGSYIPKTLIEIPVVFSEELLVIPADWKTYNNPEANFAFRYPSDWEITADYLYETPARSKAHERTVTLGKIGEKAVVQINMRQCPCPSREVSKSGYTDYIAICSEDSETMDIYKKILASFRIIK